MGSVASRYGKTNGAYRDTSVGMRGLQATSIRVACTTRPRSNSSAWTRETLVYRNDYDTVHVVPRHVPLGVSVASNLRGHERVQCLLTNGDSDKSAVYIMGIHLKICDAAYNRSSVQCRFYRHDTDTCWSKVSRVCRSGLQVQIDMAEQRMLPIIHRTHQVVCIEVRAVCFGHLRSHE